MNKYKITTDSTSDLPFSYLKENDIGLLPMSFQIDGQEFEGDKEFDVKAFYNKMREGSMSTTAQVTPQVATEKFKKILDEGYDILHIAFTSGMSGSYNSSRLAAIELQEEYPDSKIIVIDSLCASLGEGLLVYKAVNLKNQGYTIEEVRDWIEDNKLNLCHYVTVDDLNHLYRGGRVSKATAIVGSIIGVKPIIHVNNEGKLIPIGKARGRKQSLNTLVNYMKKLTEGYEDKNDIIFISHGDCEEDAKYLADKIQKELGYDKFLFNYIGPTVGTHSGPNTIALFFMGKER